MKIRRSEKNFILLKNPRDIFKTISNYKMCTDNIKKIQENNKIISKFIIHIFIDQMNIILYILRKSKNFHTLYI